ncbi:SbcC/MukB-like Walker B domain-containing protein, partial [Phenylobacterium sp.]|uniref:SbcC/MukB-like Walker B domain-containing protein n=1 Tax=Phenylobacterium sp. TaxID=1871053 RepID=UPI0025FF6E95
QRVERVAAAEPLQAAMAQAEAAVAAAVADRGRALRDAEQARQTAAQAEQDLALARQTAAALASLELSLERLGQVKAAAEAFEAQQAIAATRAAALTQAEVAATDASTAAAAAADHLADLRARLDTAHAAQLAAALEDGRPCPVCGSLAHPQPAVGEAADGDLVERLKAAETDADTTQRALTQARTKAAEAQALATDAADRLAGLAAPERPSSALVPEIAGAQAEHARLMQTRSTAAAEAARSAAVDALTASELVLQMAEAAFADARTTLEAHKAALGTELATVPETLRQPEAAQAALDAAAKAEAEAQSAHEGAESRAAAAQQDLAVRAATLAGRRDAEARVTSAAAAAEAELTTAAAARGLAGDAYELALVDVPHIGTISAEIRQHEQTLAAALDRTARAEQGIEALAPPDLAQLEKAKAQADASLDAQLARSAADEAELRSWVQAQGRIEAAERRRAAAEAAYATVGELSRLAQGKNAVRMSLVDYAVAAYFEEVLAAANIRFGRMSGGRFELRRKTVGQDARSRAGLEILVYDGHSGRERDAKTLSGGEGFMAALALALGLSDVVQAESGGVKLDAIFIDEGFGHLDEQSLDRALDTLRELVGEARAVGVISHVDAVKAQIPAGFEVTPQLRGSRVEARSL